MILAVKDLSSKLASKTVLIIDNGKGPSLPSLEANASEIVRCHLIAEKPKEANEEPVLSLSQPLPNDQFDVVILHEVLENLKNPAEFVRDISDRVKNHLLISAGPQPDNIIMVLQECNFDVQNLQWTAEGDHYSVKVRD